jgi:hypothetical protein
MPRWTRLAGVGVAGMVMMASEEVWLTICENADDFATKIIGATKDGKIRKRSAAQIVRGKAKRAVIKDLRDLSPLLGKFGPKQAACYGVTQAETAPLVTKKVLMNGSCPSGAIARTRQHFSQEPGILFGDYDPRKGYPPRSWKENDDLFCEIIPEWSKAERLWRPSSGSEAAAGTSMRSWTMHPRSRW